MARILPQMQDKDERRVVRFVPPVEMDQDISDGNMWFLSHFAVLKDSKTTPIRVVYDGKASYQGHSLNDSFATGRTWTQTFLKSPYVSENLNSELL